MKQAYVTSWKSSKQPRKQRKYIYNAPAHARASFVSSTLSKDLRTKHGIRSLPVRVGDKVKILRGQFRGTMGKITLVDRTKARLHIEGAEHVKTGGSKSPYPVHPSNVMLIELNASDKRRLATKQQKSPAKTKTASETKSEKTPAQTKQK